MLRFDMFQRKRLSQRNFYTIKELDQPKKILIMPWSRNGPDQSLINQPIRLQRLYISWVMESTDIKSH